MSSPKSDQQYSLFSARPLEAFEHGKAAELVVSRNPQLGNLLTTERAPFYVTILYRMLLFRRDHELEPLYEDIFHGVEQPLGILEKTEYSQERFRTDLSQLEDWHLVTSRIEKQRLRGYRDNRKRKFRYRLGGEASSLLLWLEDRRQDDLEEHGHDARDLLGEMSGTLSELLRLLHGLRLGGEEQGDIGRRIIFQLGRADDLCQAITTGLIDLNGRLLAFLVLRYEPEEVRVILGELDHYVQVFLKQAYVLRLEITPLLVRLHKKTDQEKLHHAFTIMENQRHIAPHLLQVRRETSGLAIPGRLTAFFDDQGGLDRLLRRINESSLQVWQKLRSHLQELERKNHRLEDLRERIAEIATLDEDAVPLQFFEKLFSSACGSFDRRWDHLEKADPPQPARRIKRKEKVVRAYLKPKKKGDGPVQSMDESRLALLESWLTDKVLTGSDYGLVGQAHYDEYEDFPKIIELAKAGLLDGGKRLERISMTLQAEDIQESLAFADCQLDLPKLYVRKNEY